jgi:DNA-binding CsgD family transcriptional regulator
MQEKIALARLAVVQTSSRLGFQRRALDALRTLAPASSAALFLGTDDSRAYAEGVHYEKNRFSEVKSSVPLALSAAFGFDAKSVTETPRRVYVSDELYDAAGRLDVPYFKAHAGGGTYAALLFLHEGGVLFAMAVLERSDAAFTHEELAALEAVAPFLVAGARSQLAYDDLSREAACLRAGSKRNGSYYVVNRDKKKVIWAANRVRGIEWADDVLAHEPTIVDALEIALAAQQRGEALPTPPRLGHEVVVSTAKLDDEPVFGKGRFAVLCTEETSKTQNERLKLLSKREREIARLLVAGYSGVNVAAIAGLSENTVRTYVRRLYAKLEVANRADLVRKLVAPLPTHGPTSKAPSSTIAPPVDSALAYGDDTLDD